MVKKIIILFESPFDKRDYNRFGVDLLLKNGYAIEGWDILKTLYPETIKNVKLHQFEFPGLRRFKSRKEVISASGKLSSKDIIILGLSYDLIHLWIYQAISKSKCHYVFLQNNPYPTFPSNWIKEKGTVIDLLSRSKRALRNLFSRNWVDIINKFGFQHVPYQFLGIKPPLILFFGGSMSVIRRFFKCPFDVSYTKLVPVHSFDYDMFLQQQKASTNKNLSNIAVFLDSNLPFHPDNALTNRGSAPVSKENYYPALCRFFDFVEKEQGVEVVIAAHPSSHYEDHEELFGGRRCYRLKSAELIERAKFGINHCSAVVNFAILYKKPVLFIYTNEMVKSGFVKLVENQAKWVGKTAINIDNTLSINWDTELSVNNNLYAKYKETFIKAKGTPEMPLWQIVADELRGI